MRTWEVECKKCEKTASVSVGDFRKITQMNFEFILKPFFVCGECKEDCQVTLKGEKE